MRLEIFGVSIFDIDLTHEEGACIVLLALIIMVIAIAAPLWKWW
jgi:hypothetical protein